MPVSKKIIRNQEEFYSNWYNIILRELMVEPSLSNDPKNIAKIMYPSISPLKVKKSMKIILDLGMVKRKGEKYIQDSAFIATGSVKKTQGLKNFHKHMGKLAIDSIDKISRDERNITACTVKVSEKAYKKLEKRIAECREDILKISKEDRAKSNLKIFNINFQLFPLTKTFAVSKNVKK